MVKVGDLVIYSSHGICRVDDICELSFGGSTKEYYVLEPVENDGRLKIHAPVDKKNNMQPLIDKTEAQKVIESFRQDGVEWVDRPQSRTREYKDIVSKGDRIEIAKVANTLLRKKHETEEEGKKFSELDGKLLKSIQDILFKEVAIALNKPYDKVVKKIDELVMQ